MPDELVETSFRNYEERAEILEWPQAIEGGLQQRFDGAAEVLKFLAGLPSPEEVLTLAPSERFARHIRELRGRATTDR